MGRRYLAAVSFALLFFCQGQDAFSQLTYTVQVVDASDQGSPLKVSGRASFTEIRRPSAFQTASRFQILLKNASEKGIILLRATVSETGPHGPTKDQQIKRDHFFWGEMSAGSAIRLLGDEGRPANLSPVVPAREPKANSVCSMSSSPTDLSGVMSWRPKTLWQRDQPSLECCFGYKARATIATFSLY